MSMERRAFLGLLTSALRRRRALETQSTWTNTGMKLSGVEAASRQVMAAVNAPAPPPAGPLQPVFTRSGGNLMHGGVWQRNATDTAAGRGGLHKLFTLTMTGDKRGNGGQNCVVWACVRMQMPTNKS